MLLPFQAERATDLGLVQTLLLLAVAITPYAREPHHLHTTDPDTTQSGAAFDFDT